ncbi:MAG: SMP-30/gluconolactonase/LRE family protein [Bacteroidota bacterium]
MEKLNDRFDEIIPPTTQLEVLTEGHGWTEGPLWLPEQKCVIYSDVPKNIAYRWSESDGKTKYLEPSGYTGDQPNRPGSNGLALDNDGNLVLCHNGNRIIAKLKSQLSDPQPIYDTLAASFEGKKFNSPNDLVIDSKGNIYFTDPNFGLDMAEKELDFQGVYKVSPDGDVQLLTSKWATPNGIGLSPDERTLYIANTKPALFISYDILENGELANEKILMDMEDAWEKSVAKQRPDGMAINQAGVIFLTGPDGVFVIAPDGTHLGTIKTDKRTSNCTFNEDESVLYITCHELLLRAQL